MKKLKPAQVMLRKEFMDVKKNPRSEFFQIHDLVNSNIQEWEIYVIGPPETPYENGIYKAHMRFPDEYPMKPPSIQFMCDMLHPNIYRDGKVCISTLQLGPDGQDSVGHFWRPVLGIEQAILSVVSLLSDPNIDDPANTGAANLYKLHRTDFLQRCKNLANKSKSLVPSDFEFPKVKPIEKPKTGKEKREGLRPTVEAEETQSLSLHASLGLKKLTKEEEEEELDDGFLYDPEDLSEDGFESSSVEHEDEKSLKKFDEEDDQEQGGGHTSQQKSTSKSASAAKSGNGGAQSSAGTSQSKGTQTGSHTNQAAKFPVIEMMRAKLNSRPSRKHDIGMKMIHDMDVATLNFLEQQVSMTVSQKKINTEKPMKRFATALLRKFKRT